MGTTTNTTLFFCCIAEILTLPQRKMGKIIYPGLQTDHISSDFYLNFGTFHQQLDILTGTVALRVERHVLGPLLLDQGDTHCANQSINTWGRLHQRKGNQSELIKLTDWFAVLLGSGLLDVCLEISSQQRCLVDMFTMMNSFAQTCL